MEVPQGMPVLSLQVAGWPLEGWLEGAACPVLGAGAGGGVFFCCVWALEIAVGGAAFVGILARVRTPLSEPIASKVLPPGNSRTTCCASSLSDTITAAGALSCSV